MGKLQSSSLDRRFFHRLGASLLDRTICATAGSLGYEFTLGPGPAGGRPAGGAAVQVHHQLGLEHRHHQLATSGPDDRGPQEAGATIVTIDPYRSQTASRSDWHIAAPPGHRRRPGPGPDARDLARRPAGRRLPDQSTVGRRAAPPAGARGISARSVAAITGLAVATIETFARRLAREQPSLIRLNYGMQRHRGGGMAVRTITCLPAIIGSWRHPGGGALLSTSGTYDFAMDRLTRPDLSPPGTRTINMDQLAEALAGELPGPPVRALYVYNSNPAAVAPDQRRCSRACAAKTCSPSSTSIPHRHGRLRRHRAAGHHAARALRHPRLLRPSRGDVQPPPSPRAASAARTTTSSAPWPPAWASSPSCSPTTRR